MTWLIPLPVVVPLIGAGFTLAFYKSPTAQRLVSLLSLVIVTAASLALVFGVDSGPIVVEVGAWPAPVGIVLVADRLSALMLAVSSIVTLGVLAYSLGQGMADGEKAAPLAIYHPTYLALSAGVSIAFLSGDLFNLYVGFEVLLVASYVLITLGGTRARIRSGTVYIVVAVLSSAIFLAAVAMIYAATGTVNFAQLALRMTEIDPAISVILEAMLLIAFGIKAAIFPLSAWLPDSYPTAPAPVTAVFAGLLTKVGVYAILRVETLLFGTGEVNRVLLILALATMLAGVLGAVAQNDIKRLLSFTLVSHIGYMVLGIGLGSLAGLSGAIFYVVHHITVQTTLFLVVGLIERRGGSTSLDKLGGLAKAAPLLAVLYLLPAASLGGIPPLSGFLGKIGLLQAAVHIGTPLAITLVVGAVVTSLLTLYALLKAWNKAFWQDAPKKLEDVPLPLGMVGPTAVLVGVILSITVIAGPLYEFTERAAASLYLRTPYINSVLPDGDVLPTFLAGDDE